MRKKQEFTSEQAGKEAQAMIRQLQTNAREIAKRSHDNERVQKLCKQLDEFSTNLLEWGVHQGNVEIWASFTPSMFDFSSTDEPYGQQ